MNTSHSSGPASDDRFEFLAESLPEKIFAASINGEITYLNQQWARYTGRPVEEIQERGWRDFIYEDDLEEKEHRWKNAMATGEPFECEHRLRRFDGDYRWHLSRAQPMRRSDGSISVWIGSNIDVDDLKRAQFALRESESRLRLAMEAESLGFWDWQIGGTVKWSPEHNRIIGLDPTQLEGQFETALQRVHPDDRSRLTTALQHAQEARQDLEIEFRVIHDGESVRWISAHGRAYYEEQSGRPIRMIGVVRDITERKEAEEQLRRNQGELGGALSAAEHAREQAESAGRAKDQFLAVLSHELRTPLTPILMAVSATIGDPGIPSHVREALEMIQRNIKIEARLIEDLLDLTRITRNTIELDLAPMDLHATVQAALEICQPDIQSKKYLLRVDLAAAHSHMSGDASRLQQVFWNLIKNAVKFTPERGQIIVRSFNTRGKICVEIADSGLGIEPGVLPSIFNPFEQGDQSFARRFGGLGLGLAISKATIEAHQGRLTAQSPGKGHGATFTVELSLLDA